VTSAEKPSGPLKDLKLEKVEDPKEERGTGREAERALEVGVAETEVGEGLIPSLSERVLSQKPPITLPKIGFPEAKILRAKPLRQIESKRISMKREAHGPAAERRSFRGELEPRQEHSRSSESGRSPGTQAEPKETKCAAKLKKKSLAKKKRRAQRTTQYYGGNDPQPPYGFGWCSTQLSSFSDRGIGRLQRSTRGGEIGGRGQTEEQISRQEGTGETISHQN
jgi:hypothetical protein